MSPSLNQNHLSITLSISLFILYYDLLYQKFERFHFEDSTHYKNTATFTSRALPIPSMRKLQCLGTLRDSVGSNYQRAIEAVWPSPVSNPKSKRPRYLRENRLKCFLKPPEI